MNRSVVRGLRSKRACFYNSCGTGVGEPDRSAIEVGPYQDMVPFGYSNDSVNEFLSKEGGEFAVQNPTAKVSA
jgi:hypothetical protein